MPRAREAGVALTLHHDVAGVRHPDAVTAQRPYRFESSCSLAALENTPRGAKVGGAWRENVRAKGGGPAPVRPTRGPAPVKPTVAGAVAAPTTVRWAVSATNERNIPNN